jgi:hypothetical protein
VCASCSGMSLAGYQMFFSAAPGSPSVVVLLQNLGGGEKK